MSRHAVRRRADHRAAAEQLREMPGVELLVATYRAAYSARTTAIAVQQAARLAYAPAGSFEARVAPVDDETGLYVRYVGAVEVTA